MYSQARFVFSESVTQFLTLNIVFIRDKVLTPVQAQNVIFRQIKNAPRNYSRCVSYNVKWIYLNMNYNPIEFLNESVRTSASSL